jgi:DNA-binding NarL/FixJ family response regulator
MRTPLVLREGIAEVLRLASLVVRGAPPDEPEARRRVEHDVEVAVEALRRVAARVAGAALGPATARPRDQSLTDRETRFVQLLVAGRSYKEIAEELGLSVLSVQSRVKAIYMKLAVHSKGELRALLGERALDDALRARVMDPRTTP